MITKKLFGKTLSGQDVHAYTFSDSVGEAVILNYGGTIQSLKIRDKNGCRKDVALGYNTVREYQENSGYLGALIGRYANRIGGAKFTLGNKEYILYANNGKNHLHGGREGFDKKLWNAEISGSELVLTLNSPDNEEGYPGNLDVKVTYSFSNGRLKINYEAVSGSDTVINLTNHCYFNLGGENSGSVLSHKLKIYADGFTPTDGESIPTGEIAEVSGTPFDFKEFKEIGKDIAKENVQLLQAKGYDHNYVLNGKGYRLAAEAFTQKSGILMRVYTDKEGIQFYSGNYLYGAMGKGGSPYNKNGGFCLETQHFPDSINKADFPSPVLKAGEKYRYTTSYEFSLVQNAL